ncbi:sulfate ABC transporter permease subunit CysT [Rhodococcoides fascians]|uniref:sulfate ABC transporter permease subunit CysT n=1 Tax=Rhodococcoides fascians TaxID=1828 RepID=UPI0024B93F01|nr:sulfate ABC transporter permease subunit CysT [Rhodococcus fascians]MDJ0411383.1 sulfate ABC transporter permease subunit CysT [Rhodococcus fascians]
MSSSTGEPAAPGSIVPPSATLRFRAGREGRKFRGPGSVGPLGLGVAVLWLSVIVLLPLAALTVQSFDGGLGGFWDAVTETRAIATFKVTLLVSVAAAVINLFLGTLIAWVLVRDEFPGKRFVNALIDLPFALPTIVASLVLLSLYGPSSPIGIVFNATKPAVIVALLFVTLPFVVRAVQPVLIELDKDVEEAAASLGANNWTIFRRIVLPVLLPAVLSGGGLAFARAIGEFGSVVLIGGNIPNDTQVASQYIRELIEYDRPIDAAAISVVLLAIAFAVLFVLRIIGNRLARREEQIS